MARPSLKEKILNAAVDHLTATGYGATSVQDITDAAQAPKGSFYNHFRSKEHLAVEALEAFLLRSGRERLKEESVPPLERLRNFFEFMIANIESRHFQHGCLLGGLAAFVDESLPLVQQAASVSYTDVTSSIAAVLGEAKGRGELAGDVDLNELATVIFDTWEGACLRARVEGRRRPFDAFLSVIFGKLITGITPRRDA